MVETDKPRLAVRRVFLAPVKRWGDWFVRKCPTCHRPGYVGIFPGRDEEAFKHISQPAWECMRCSIDREAAAGGA